MNVTIWKIYNSQGIETGSILSTTANIPINVGNKMIAENRLKEYAHNTLYPGEALNFYSDIENNSFSITVIKGINSLEQRSLSI